jgi:hypothetical protein
MGEISGLHGKTRNACKIVVTKLRRISVYCRNRKKGYIEMRS